jgi:hypothetical protein
MRSDRLLLPNCFDYEHSRLSCSRHLSETCVSLSPQGLPLKKETGGPCVSRRTDPLRRVTRVRVWRCRPLAPESTVPLTSLSLFRSSPAAFASSALPTEPRSPSQVPREG